MATTGTHVAYFHLCHRKLWLFANGINMEQRSELVAEGKFIDETSYEHRANRWQQLEIEKVKIDHVDVKQGIVKEVKKSRKKESAHMAQLKYYLYVLERNGMNMKYGLLEYPRLRQTERVYLTPEDRQAIPKWEQQIHHIIIRVDCPVLVKKGICKKCAYYEFCFT